MTDLFENAPSTAVWWPWDVMSEQFGPMLPSDLVTIMASTGSGKTTFVTSAIMGWIDAKVDLALISTEDSRDQIREKMAAAEAGIPERWLATRDMSEATKTQQETFRTTQRMLADVPILGLEDFGEKTLDTLQETIQGAMGWYEDRGRNLQLLVLDHLHEIGPRRDENQLDAWAQTVLMLRDVGSRAGVVVVMVAQPKRPARETIPAMYRNSTIHDARGVPQVETCSKQMFGLRRRLRPMDNKERREAVADISANRSTIHDYAMRPPQTEVECLKRRIWGECVHRTANLELRHGRLVDPNHVKVPF